MTWTRGDATALDERDLDDLAEMVIGRVAQKLRFEEIVLDPDSARRSEQVIRDMLAAAIDDSAAVGGFTGSGADRSGLAAKLLNEIAGLGPVTSYLNDKSVSEIMVNGEGRIFVERGAEMVETRRKYQSAAHLLGAIRRMASLIGRQIDEDTPYVDARLPDGSRVNAIIPPVSPDGPSLTIRKFSRAIVSMQDLVRHDAVTGDAALLLETAVKGRLNILISGGTNSGKTTMLNAMAQAIEESERIVTIEDSCELQLMKRNLVRLETRPPDLFGRGEISMRALVRNALRMRPDRIIVGEVRGAECFDMLQAMNTGHNGSMSTIHANTPRDALTRVETTFLLGGLDIPVPALRRQIASAIHLLVHLERMADGVRRVARITEVLGMEGDVITTQELFDFQYDKVSRPGEVKGELLPTGLVPKFNSILELKGYRLPVKIFGGKKDEKSKARY